MQNPTRPYSRLSFLLPLLALALSLAPPVSAQAVCQAPAAAQHDIEPSDHIPNCSQTSFTHYPPTSGTHYPAWAHYQTFKFVVNPGYYVHSLEHGAIVFLVNCKKPGDCGEDFARLQRIADAAPEDSLCDTATRHRIVIAEDTVMESRFAALAWGWSIQSDCIDSAAFAAFIQAHYAQGTENICYSGTVFAGDGWCSGPLDLKPGRSPADFNGRASRGAQLLWKGDLSERGRLTVEAVSVSGKVLGVRDLGQAGPGPAQAAWDASLNHGGSGFKNAILRVRFKSASGIRTLSESR
jgi:uncharacterized protein DUF3105